MKEYIEELRAAMGSRPLILPGANVIVVDEEHRILLMKRVDTGDWGLPGGLMEPGESFEETSRREVLEETGLAIGELRLLDVFSGKEYFYICPNGDQVYNVTAAYTTMVEDVTGLYEKSNEASELRFFALHEIPTDVLPPEQPIIAAYINMVAHKPDVDSARVRT